MLFNDKQFLRFSPLLVGIKFAAFDPNPVERRTNRTFQMQKRAKADVFVCMTIRQKQGSKKAVPEVLRVCSWFWDILVKIPLSFGVLMYCVVVVFFESVFRIPKFVLFSVKTYTSQTYAVSDCNGEKLSRSR